MSVYCVYLAMSKCATTTKMPNFTKRAETRVIPIVFKDVLILLPFLTIRYITSIRYQEIVICMKIYSNTFYFYCTTNVMITG